MHPRRHVRVNKFFEVTNQTQPTDSSQVYIFFTCDYIDLQLAYNYFRLNVMLATYAQTSQ